MNKEIIMLIIGAIIGFVVSIITIKYQEFKDRKRASKILLIELFKISKLITPFAKQESGISMDEIPNFVMSTQIDIFLSLKDTLRMSISEISIDLERAENNRKRALALLNQPNRINECKLYTHLYLDFLKSAEMKINKMKVLLK